MRKMLLLGKKRVRRKILKDELTAGALVLAFIDGEGANADLI